VLVLAPHAMTHLRKYCHTAVWRKACVRNHSLAQYEVCFERPLISNQVPSLSVQIVHFASSVFVAAMIATGRLTFQDSSQLQSDYYPVQSVAERVISSHYFLLTVHLRNTLVRYHLLNYLWTSTRSIAYIAWVSFWDKIFSK
jgi:hypothetical protein